MGSYRNDILKEWLDFREEDIASLSCKADKENLIYFDEISQNIIGMVFVMLQNYFQAVLCDCMDQYKIYQAYGIAEVLIEFIKKL